MIESYITRKNFRILLIFSILFIFLSFFIDDYYASHFSTSYLTDYNNFVYSIETKNLELYFLSFAGIVLYTYFALFMFWRHSRILFIFLFFASILFNPIYGEEIFYNPISEISEMLSYFQGVFDGVILALVYISPLKDQFQKY